MASIRLKVSGDGAKLEGVGMVANGAKSAVEQATDRFSGSERRRFKRIAMKLRMVVELADDPAVPSPRESATTENVSPGDVYFHTAIPGRLEVGSRVHLKIDLPAATGDYLFTGRHLHVRGEVVRLDSPDDQAQTGVAVRFLHTPRFAGAFE